MIFGLTGMSGAGKSTVCRQFQDAGFHIIDCAKVARQVVGKGEPCLDELHRLFGDGVITKDGELDRKAMGNIVYVDMHEEDDEVAKGEDVGAVESVKEASDLI